MKFADIFIFTAILNLAVLPSICLGTSENLVLVSQPGKYEATTKRPDCDLLQGYHHTQHSSSFALCSKVFSEVPNANVVYFEKNIECTIFHCKQTEDGSDWDYKWGQNNVVGETYSLPHPSNLNYYGSYFIQDVHPIKLPENYIHNLPKVCKGFAFDKTESKTHKEYLQFFFDSGFNFVKYNKLDKTYTAYQCQTNSEGTGYEHFQQCYPLKGTDTESWYILLAPAIPRFRNGTFTLRSAGICHKSSCVNQNLIHGAKDIRQCMHYALQKGYNVINYLRNSGVCDLRRCPEIYGDERDLMYTTQGVTPGTEVYAWQHSGNITIAPITTVATTTTTKTPIPNKIERNNTGLIIALVLGWLAFIITFVIALVLYRNNKRLKTKYQQVDQL